MRRLTLVGVVIVAALLRTDRAEARRLENWPYEQLFREADLVVFARAVSVVESGEKTTANLWKAEFLGRTTTFAVNHVLKGKPAGKTVKVLHFRLKEGVLIEDGPLLVAFRTKQAVVQVQGKKQLAVGPPEYLLFLRKGADGRYEPVSGRVDPQLSVREVYGQSPIPQERGRGEPDGRESCPTAGRS